MIVIKLGGDFLSSGVSKSSLFDFSVISFFFYRLDSVSSSLLLFPLKISLANHLQCLFSFAVWDIHDCNIILFVTDYTDTCGFLKF